jgi:hypothetical protein
MRTRFPLRRRRRDPAAESPWPALFAAGVPPRSGEGAGKRILIATNVGGHPVARVVDSLVGVALWLRGAEPEFLLCDGALPACEMCSYDRFEQQREFVRNGPQGRICGWCFEHGRSWLGGLPLPLRRFGDNVSREEAAAALADTAGLDLEECFAHERDGLQLGEQARASVLRYFGKADLTSEPDELVLAAARRYLAGALTAALAAERALAEVQPECVVGHHGVYVPQGVFGEVARREGVRVANWGPSYRDRTVIYSHGDTYHRTFIDEPAERWRSRPLSATEDEALTRYLASRRLGRGDWSWVTPEAALRPTLQERDELVRGLGLDLDRPVFGLLTNVLWDAQLYYEGHAFPDMLEWLWATIELFRARPDWQLVVRVHPHEIKIGNRQPVVPELERRYPDLPGNVVVVPPEHSFNTYGLMDLCDAVLLYGTKTGVELAPLGQRVVVCGDAWSRGKGFTFDVEQADGYAPLLEKLAADRGGCLDDDKIRDARAYAYHYFFRRMIPLSSFAAGADSLRLGIGSLDELRPGVDAGLDVVCAGILDGLPFEYEPETAVAYA